MTIYHSKISEPHSCCRPYYMCLEKMSLVNCTSTWIQWSVLRKPVRFQKPPIAGVQCTKLSTMKLRYDSLILSHLQFGKICWGFECKMPFKQEKRTLHMLTNIKYNSHTEPLSKEEDVLKVSDIFGVHSMKVLHKFGSSIFWRDAYIQ